MTPGESVGAAHGAAAARASHDALARPGSGAAGAGRIQLPPERIQRDYTWHKTLAELLAQGLTRIQQHIQDREQTWNGPDL